MSQISSIGAGFFSDLSVFTPATALTPAQLAALDSAPEFHTLFTNEIAREKARRTDIAMDEIRARFGFQAICRACTLVDRPLTDFNVQEDHTVHPVGYFQGRKMVV